MIAILNQNQVKRKLFSREIRCSVKDTLLLYKFVIEKLGAESVNTNVLNEEECTFITKIKGKKTEIEVKDTKRENFLEINAYNYRSEFLNGIYRWSNKQILGLKYSLWIFLLVIAIALVPLIISLTSQDNISESLQSALQISGIVLISTGGALSIIYLIFSRISFGNFTKRYDKISDFVENIVVIIDKYEADIMNKKICWSCYKEIEGESPKCPHCGIDL